MTENAAPVKASQNKQDEIPEEDRAQAAVEESSTLSSRTLNIVTLVVAVLLIAGGITIEQIQRHEPEEELARPDLHEEHIVNLRPETKDVLPEAFIEKIANCSERTLSGSIDGIYTGAHGYVCWPWLTKEQDDNPIMTYHSTRSVIIGEEASRIRAELPNFHNGGTDTKILQEGSGDQPDILTNTWDDGEYGTGDIYIYYPEEKVMVTWVWNKSDPGAANIEDVIREEGF